MYSNSGQQRRAGSHVHLVIQYGTVHYVWMPRRDFVVGLYLIFLNYKWKQGKLDPTFKLYHQKLAIKWMTWGTFLTSSVLFGQISS